MSEIGDVVDEVRTELADASEEFMPDLCNLWGPIFQDGGAGGDTEQFLLLESDVPCKYGPAVHGSRNVVGGEAYQGSHLLTLPRTPETVAITPKYLIKVLERGDTAEQVFEKPSIVPGSMPVFLKVMASLVTQGYQE